jgi:nucleoside permease NupC
LQLICICNSIAKKKKRGVEQSQSSTKIFIPHNNLAMPASSSHIVPYQRSPLLPHNFFVRIITHHVSHVRQDQMMTYLDSLLNVRFVFVACVRQPTTSLVLASHLLPRQVTQRTIARRRTGTNRPSVVPTACTPYWKRYRPAIY